MTRIQCELCYEWVSLDLIRFYKYENVMDEEIKYIICEDCVIHHKKYCKGKDCTGLGIEIKWDNITSSDTVELMKKNYEM